MAKKAPKKSAKKSHSPYQWMLENFATVYEGQQGDYNLNKFYDCMVDSWLTLQMKTTWGFGYFSQGSGPMGFHYQLRSHGETPQEIWDRFWRHVFNLGGAMNLLLLINFHDHFRHTDAPHQDLSGRSVAVSGLISLRPWQILNYLVYIATGRILPDNVLVNELEAKYKKEFNTSNSWFVIPGTDFVSVKHHLDGGSNLRLKFVQTLRRWYIEANHDVDTRIFELWEVCTRKYDMSAAEIPSRK